MIVGKVKGEKEMGFSTAGRNSPSNKIRIARYMKGECGICLKMIMPGEAYDKMDGSNTSNVRLVHYNCYKPEGSPTWEELKVRKSLQRGRGYQGIGAINDTGRKN